MDKQALEQLVKLHAGEAQFNPVMRVREHFEKPEPGPLAKIRTLYKFLAQAEVYVDGVDISHWNTVQSFADMYAGGVRFVIIKATDGLSVDQKFELHWKGALDASMIPGVYHFFRGHISGVAQADFHLQTIQPLLEATNKAILPPNLDVESTDGVTVATRRARITEWLSTVRVKFRAPGVYSSPYLWQSLTNNMSITDYWGWVAHWTPYDFTLPGGWAREKTNMHQRGIYPTHSWCPQVRGVQGAVDTNRFLGSYDDLRIFAGITQTPVMLPQCTTITSLPVFSGPGVDHTLTGETIQPNSLITVYAMHRDFVRISADNETPRWVPGYALNYKAQS